MTRLSFIKTFFYILSAHGRVWHQRLKKMLIGAPKIFLKNTSQSFQYTCILMLLSKQLNKCKKRYAIFSSLLMPTKFFGSKLFVWTFYNFSSRILSALNFAFFDTLLDILQNIHFYSSYQRILLTSQVNVSLINKKKLKLSFINLSYLVSVLHFIEKSQPIHSSVQTPHLPGQVQQYFFTIPTERTRGCMGFSMQQIEDRFCTRQSPPTNLLLGSPKTLDGILGHQFNQGLESFAPSYSHAFPTTGRF